MQAVARGRVLGTGSVPFAGAAVQRGRTLFLINDPSAAVVAGNVALADMLPLANTDALFFRGAEVAIQDIDDDTRRVDGVLIALNIMVKG